ncbi:MAG: DMP19 family protein [Paracoccaceae bacterium]
MAERPRVVVRASVLTAAKAQPEDLVYEVVCFVNAMFERGLFLPDELPPEAVQVYMADYYLAQVNNGGHSQYIGNSRQRLEMNSKHTVAGLQAMGATAQLGIHKAMLDWVDANPVEALEQTGFTGGIAPYLKDLDRSFYETEGTSPMAALSAVWIAGWSSLQVVEDNVYAHALDVAAQMNPNRTRRLQQRRLAIITQCCTDPLRVAMGLAAMAGKERDVVCGIGGATYESIDGEVVPVFVVGTMRGRRFGTWTQNGGVLYERAEPGTLAQSAQARGAVWGQVSTQSVSDMIAAAKHVQADAAICFLMTDAFGGTDFQGFSGAGFKRAKGKVQTIWAIVRADLMLLAIVQDGEAVLKTTDEKVLARISGTDIKRRLQAILD